MFINYSLTPFQICIKYCNLFLIIAEYLAINIRRTKSENKKMWQIFIEDTTFVTLMQKNDLNFKFIFVFLQEFDKKPNNFNIFFYLVT